MTAGHVVLACGGIENARLPLNSDSRIPGGVGNASGTVGRFFAGHAIVTAGVATVAAGARGNFANPRWSTDEGDELVPHLIATPEARPLPGPMAARSALAARAREDFAAGRTSRCDGWILSQTEATGLWALVEHQPQHRHLARVPA